MKPFFASIVLCLFFTSAFGQVAVPDTIYIYETIIVYDTIVVRDTIRVKRSTNMPVVQPKSIDVIYFSQPSENVLSPTATFSENRIILHESNSYQKQKNVKTMKPMKLKTVNNLTAIILAAQTMSGLSAQETQTVNELKNFPIQLSVVYPMTTQGAQTVDYHYNFSFNLLSGKVGAVTGIEFGGLANKTNDLNGIQFAGLRNSSSTTRGLQFAGLANISGNNTGIQFAGLTNISESCKGIEFAGISNISGSIIGLQFAGITNISKQMAGLQFSGISNQSEYIHGAQFAGITNLTAKIEGFCFSGVTNIAEEVSGASISGVYNRTGTLRGFQFGVVSVIDTIESGVSMAIINIVKKGFYNEWALTFADYQNVGLSYKMGTQKLYTIFSAGANLLEDKLWVFGIGFGHRRALNRRFDFQPEAVFYHYFPNDFRHVQYLTSSHLKLGFVYKLNEKIGIVVAPSVFNLNSDLYESGQAYKITPIKDFYSYIHNNQYFNSLGMGISVGLVWR